MSESYSGLLGGAPHLLMSPVAGFEGESCSAPLPNGLGNNSE